NMGGLVIVAEMEILTSWDLALQVVDAIGPERILAKVGGGNNRNEAAAVVMNGVTVDTPRKGNVISVSCSHADPEMAQLILSKLMDFYAKRHGEMHRESGVFDFLTQQTDQLRSQLVQTEEELTKLKGQSDMISVEDSRKEIMTQLSTIRAALLEAEAD